MRLVLNGSLYKLNDVVIRPEFGGYLLYLPSHDLIYFINQSAKDIIDIMQEKSETIISIKQITKIIQDKYIDCKNVNIQDIKKYIYNLIEMEIVSCLLGDAYE